MKTIHKHALDIEDEISIGIQEGAEILTIQVQNGFPTIWYLIDDDKPLCRRTLEIFGTGNPIKELPPTQTRQYIGTFQLLSGAIVFHVFEKKSNPDHVPFLHPQ